MSVVVKAIFNGNVSRFRLSSSSTFEEFVCNICCVFKRHDSLEVSYIDDEGDTVYISTDTELSEAIRQYPVLLRVQVHEPRIHQEDPLFNSWVIVQQQNSSVLQTKIENLSSKIKTCEVLTKVAQQTPAPENYTITVATSTDDGSSPKETKQIKQNIREMVQQLAHEIAQEMVEVSAQVAASVSSDQTRSVICDFYQTSAKVTEIIAECLARSQATLAEVTTLACNAVALVEADSASILQDVHLHSNCIRNILTQLAQSEKQTEKLSQLSADVSANGLAVSKQTAQQCVSDAEDIRALVMSV